MTIINSLEKIKQEIKTTLYLKRLKLLLLANISIITIMPLINHGHIHFGENKVQETEKKNGVK